MPKIRLFNPHRATRRRKKNQGGTLTYMANPKKRNAHRRKNRKNPAARARRRPNPFFSSAPRRRRNWGGQCKPRRNRRRRNPDGLALGQAKDVAINALFAIGTGILTRSLPQAVLGEDKNKGWPGYLGNGLVAAGSGFLVYKFAGPARGQAALLGGAVMLAGRILEDVLGKKIVEFSQVNLPFIPKLLSGDPRYDLRLMGDFEEANFVVPYSSLGPLSRIRPPVAEVLPPAGRKTGTGKMGWTEPWTN